MGVSRHIDRAQLTRSDRYPTVLSSVLPPARARTTNAKQPATRAARSSRASPACVRRVRASAVPGSLLTIQPASGVSHRPAVLLAPALSCRMRSSALVRRRDRSVRRRWLCSRTCSSYFSNDLGAPCPRPLAVFDALFAVDLKFREVGTVLKGLVRAPPPSRESWTKAGSLLYANRPVATTCAGSRRAQFPAASCTRRCRL